MSLIQYNAFAHYYSNSAYNFNLYSSLFFHEHFAIPLKNKRLLDMGCGSGSDFSFYLQEGAIPHGIDESVEMIKLARQSFPQNPFEMADFREVPYQDDFFDVVCSKWAYQTAFDIDPIYKEVFRVLKAGGDFIYLVVHPLRQFMEKKKKEKDYFKKEVVDSSFYDHHITISEPSHTFKEYFSPFFLRNFEILGYEEQVDPSAEVIDGAIYPSFFLIRSRKKK